MMAKNRRLRSMSLSQDGGKGTEAVLEGQVAQVTTLDPSSASGTKRITRGIVKVATGLGTSQLDSPLPGPADVVGAGMVTSGLKDIGVGTLQLLMSSPSPNVPEDDCESSHYVHRALGPNERKSIDNLKRFSPNPSGIEGKYFYLTRAQSIKFAHSKTNEKKPKMWRATGLIPKGLPHEHIHPAGEGPAIFVRDPALPGIQGAKVREEIKPR